MKHEHECKYSFCFKFGCLGFKNRILHTKDFLNFEIIHLTLEQSFNVYMFYTGTKNNEGEVDICMYVTMSHVAQNALRLNYVAKDDGLEILILLLYLPGVGIISMGNSTLNRCFLNN